MRIVARWLAVTVIVLAGWTAPLAVAQAGPPAPPPPPPPPLATSISPSTLAAGSPDFTLTVNGANFVTSTLVSWNNNLRATSFVSSTRLSAQILAADVSSVGTFTITVSGVAVAAAIRGPSVPPTVTVYTRQAHDTTADLVLGQPNFTSFAPNNPLMPAANHIDYAQLMTVDARTGRLFVADGNNSRVLSWSSAAAQANGQAADLVLGQPDFNSILSNVTGVDTPTAASLSTPTSMVVDAQGNLYVADGYNNRVLKYTAPLTNGQAATLVLGQPNFTSYQMNITNVVTPSAAGLNYPTGLALDAQGRLYVVDYANNRVLRWPANAVSGQAADLVLGQPNFTSGTYNITGVVTPTAASLSSPFAAALDAQGNLYVTDETNLRVLVFSAPLSSGQAASHVFGQHGHFNTADYESASADSLNSPEGVTLDALGHLYVADTDNQRVLEYDTPLADTTADRVFGQNGSFTTTNELIYTADSLSFPTGVALDRRGNLFVVDGSAERVLEFDQPVAWNELFLPLTRR